ncbi:hypothetical protein KGO95_02865 [Patescibacteria group bacterium]|nr:hypothetical protein [Patescibacteria group bacterium]
MKTADAFLGHEDLIKDFTALIKTGRLAHGYLFFGEPKIGKFAFAKNLAYLLEQGTFEATDRPAKGEARQRRPLQDAMIVPEGGGIDLMREARQFVWQRPNISSRRIVIVNDADDLTVEAQNAILKIAEEPPEHAVIILIARNLETILPPLRSRLQKIYFAPLSDADMAKEGISPKIIPIAYGRPGRAAQLAEPTQAARSAKDYTDRFLRSSGPMRSKMIKEFIDLQKEQPEMLDLFFEEVIAVLRKDPVRNAAALRDILHRLFLIKEYTTNKRLQLEALG